MPAARWTTKEQLEFLNGQLPSYLENCEAKSYNWFWPGLNTACTTEVPGEVTDPGEIQRVIDDLPYVLKSIAAAIKQRTRFMVSFICAGPDPSKNWGITSLSCHPDETPQGNTFTTLFPKEDNILLAAYQDYAELLFPVEIRNPQKATPVEKNDDIESEDGEDLGTEGGSQPPAGEDVEDDPCEDGEVVEDGNPKLNMDSPSLYRFSKEPLELLSDASLVDSTQNGSTPVTFDDAGLSFSNMLKDATTGFNVMPNLQVPPLNPFASSGMWNFATGSDPLTNRPISSECLTSQENGDSLPPSHEACLPASPRLPMPSERSTSQEGGDSLPPSHEAWLPASPRLPMPPPALEDIDPGVSTAKS
ncbi:hypothetical protein PAXRUDRAFT_17074 [Paxillus rubicundulus Ve08.2h10]|uniref:Uncharacterized protein n=1 Tax=Paxillus rubicundulus Ve08.2h10 TaxID=930991 RepID=A0A0D0C4N2_9AGAM|nr:hypothetical protein PAXRUDRAFT_17074 [Paxillus rubicundulus Ve08.2h10]